MPISIDITESVPSWLQPELAANPDAEVRVAFISDPSTFYRAMKLTAGGIEYAGNHGMPCWQPAADAVLFRIGEGGDVFEKPKPATARREPKPAANRKAAAAKAETDK